MYLEGTFDHMLPATKPPCSPAAVTSAASIDVAASSVHSQLGSSGSLAQRYCIPYRDGPRSPSKAIGSAQQVHQRADALSARDQLSAFLVESDAVSPSAGGASIYRSVMNQMPAATNLFAKVQLQQEQQEGHHHQQHQDFQKKSPYSSASNTADIMHYHQLNERVSRIEAAVTTLATTVTQLVQLLSVAAESSPQAAAAIWSTAAQLTAEIPEISRSESSIAHARPLSGSAVGPAPAASPAAHDLSHHIARSTPLAASLNDSGNASDTHGIAAPEFNLRDKIARVAELHERLCSIPTGLPVHQSVTVARQ
jgi:hypothetical protein